LQIHNALHSIGRAPDLVLSKTPGANTPGKPHEGPKTTTFFGQAYSDDILKALGVLMIRANLLEQSLISLLSAISGLDIEQSKSLFFSTHNTKARLDMIRALSIASKLNADVIAGLEKTLKSVNAVLGRRNELVHGHWKFVNDKFVVTLSTPNGKEKTKDIPVTAKSIEQLAADYHSMGTMVRATATTIPALRAIASNTAATASSGSPSC